MVRKVRFECLYRKGDACQKDSISVTLGFYSFHLKEDGQAAAAAQKRATCPGSHMVAPEELAPGTQESRCWPQL